MICRRAVRVGLRRKGGRPSLTDAGVELSDEIAQRAVSEAETCGDRLQRLLLDDHGAERFIAALLRRLGIGKEMLEPRVVHDRTSKMSLNCW
jgi:hypothetical protein